MTKQSTTQEPPITHVPDPDLDRPADAGEVFILVTRRVIIEQHIAVDVPAGANPHMHAAVALSEAVSGEAGEDWKGAGPAGNASEVVDYHTTIERY